MKEGGKRGRKRKRGQREAVILYMITSHSLAMQTSNYLFVLLEYCPQMAETSLSKNVIETGGRNIPMMIMPHCPLPTAGH